MINSILLATAFLFTDPATGAGPSCEEERRIIEGLEAELDESERAILLLEESILDLYFATSDATTASCDGKTGTEQDVCECIAEGNGAGTGLTQCLDLKTGGPTGGV